MDNDRSFPAELNIALRYSLLVSDRLSTNPLVSRVLEIVVRELGVIDVADRLGATPKLVEEWMQGEAALPESKFHALVDVLIALKPGWEHWDRK